MKAELSARNHKTFHICLEPGWPCSRIPQMRKPLARRKELALRPANYGDAVVTKTIPNERKSVQALQRPNSLHPRAVGDWRILPHAAKTCNLAPDPLSRRSHLLILFMAQRPSD